MVPSFNASAGSILLRLIPLLSFGVRNNFDICKTRLYISAPGIYEAEINGICIENHVLAPGWTPYEYELSYQTFDITTHLRQGQNVIAVHVCEGWF